MSQTCDCKCNAYTMLPVRGFGLAVDMGDAPSGNTGPDYSLEEQWTGKHWLDGKKIYQKSIPFGDLPADTVVTVPNGIANIDNIVAYEGISLLSNSTFTSLPHVASGNNGKLVSIGMTKDSINLESYLVARTGGGYVTMCYTCTDR